MTLFWKINMSKEWTQILFSLDETVKHAFSDLTIKEENYEASYETRKNELLI